MERSVYERISKQKALTIMAQEVISGNGSINNIQGLLSTHGYSDPFIIMGGHLQQQEKSLLPFTYTRWLKNGPNVLQEEIDACYAAFVSSGSRAIIAIGGGSVMDLAKAVLYNTVDKETSLPYFICVPTTAGSGSEATRFAVIYQNNIKASLDAAALLPQAVILDPVLTSALSFHQTAVSGIDALAQAIESYWNVHATSSSQAFSEEAINLLLQYLPAAVTAPTPAIREKILWAAHLAGKAINITRTTGPHALSYHLTANYHVPHGQAVAFFLPVFFLYNGTVTNETTNHPDGAEKVLAVMQRLYRLLGVNSAPDAANFIQQLMKKIGLTVRLEELGIDKGSIIDPLLESVNAQRFGNNPVAMNKERLKNLCIEYL
jgi:alcohol dehydrogenase